mmetsp:Transcript_12670/g.17983  ORF Transcript_12670/g.17983 Transcript_12670/m.17983 type:complete len:602 (-) Transcript_12670:389-2194(-)
MSSFPSMINAFVFFALFIQKTSHGWSLSSLSAQPSSYTVSRMPFARIRSCNSYPLTTTLQQRPLKTTIIPMVSPTILYAQSRSRRRQRDVYDDNDDDYDNDIYSRSSRDNNNNMDDKEYWDDGDDDFDDQTSRSRSRNNGSDNPSRRSQRWVDDFKYNDDNDNDDDNRMYYDDDDEENFDGKSSKSSSSPGAYNVYFKGSRFEDEEEPIEWELCDDGSTWVIFPPSYVTCPTAIVHFVGGTFFGSTPKLWYRTLIEELVRATQCTVVATSIPVTLFKNPLRHVSLSRKLQRQFQTAWINILADEYDEDELLKLPIVGLGHSLGARLLTVLATLSPESSLSKSKRSSRLIQMIPPYKSYILISFNNFGASASVPGIASLLKESQSLEEDKNMSKNRSRRPSSSSSRQRQSSRRRYDDYDYDDRDEEDEEWEEFVDEIQRAVKQKTSQVKSALTPESKELEFHPTPDQLWEALKDDKRYQIPQTLVIQFQYDEVDQSPRLADCLVQTNSSDVKYAWLHGNHLTPVSGTGDGDNEEGRQGSSSLSWQQWITQIPTEASKAISSLTRSSGSSSRNGQRGSSSSNDMRDLRQSIARYITDVVTKES